MNENSQTMELRTGNSLNSDELSIDILYYIRVLRKHKWSIVGITFIFTALSGFYAYTAVPIYESTATLLIESQRANIVSIEEIYGFDGSNDEYYQTQFELLKSRALAIKVIDRLDLQNHPLYVDSEEAGPFSLDTLKQLGLGGRTDSPNDDNSGIRDKVISGPDFSEQSNALEIATRIPENSEIKNIVYDFMSALTIEPLTQTQLVNITFESPDPDLAALVPNTVGEVYIESYLDAKMEMTQKAAEWLSDRLGSLKLKLDESERRLIEFREENNLIDVAGTVGKLNEQQVTIATTELSLAKRELAEIEGLYREIERLKRNNPELLDTIPVVQQDALVRTFSIERDQQQRELDELSNRYGNKHPKIIDAKSRLAVVNDSLSRQIERVIASIRNDFEVANNKVISLNESLDDSKREIQDINKKKFELSSLEREVDANRKLYDTFFNRIRETDETDGLETANARISDRAVSSDLPAKPKKLLILAIATLAGFIAAVLISFLREQMDDTIKGAEELETRLGVPLLGIVPLLKLGILSRKKKVPLSPFSVKDKRGTFIESIRTIRTSLCLDNINSPHKLVLVTSSVPSEGKSTVVTNLAHSLSQLEKTLIVDADMRRPTIAKAFSIPEEQPGLADYLSRNSQSNSLHISECVIKSINDTNLDVLPCGQIPENPLELLSSVKFFNLLKRFAQHYDRVIIDCAPTQAVSDALVLSKQCDTVIYAVKSHSTSLSSVRRGLKRLKEVGGNVLGIVVTQVDLEKISGYGGDYYYHGYYDHYGYNGASQKSNIKRNSKKLQKPVAKIDHLVKETA